MRYDMKRFLPIIVVMGIGLGLLSAIVSLYFIASQYPVSHTKWYLLIPFSVLLFVLAGLCIGYGFRKLKSTLIVLVVISSLLLIGCVQATPVAPIATQPAVITDVSQTPEAIAKVTSETVQPPPDDRTWLSPGKVQISNYYPGATAEYNVTVHNGNNIPTTFAVTYREPSYVATGYVKAPSEAQNWVIIADTAPILAPRETRDILVTLAMPGGIINYPMKWVFWISVIEKSQSGMVTTEICSTWCVQMR
jgi:hypothetical protein